MGPQGDDGSGVTLAVALRAVPVYPATAATTAAATPSANSENLLLTLPPPCPTRYLMYPREEPLPACPMCVRRVFRALAQVSSWEANRPLPRMGRRPRRWRNGIRDRLKSDCPSGLVGSNPT